jgi:hypothetical protein
MATFIRIPAESRDWAPRGFSRERSAARRPLTPALGPARLLPLGEKAMPPLSDAATAQALAILEQVRLESLKATPGTIAPFAASEISWSVSGPGGFSVRLDAAQVAHTGNKLVTPSTSRTYQLKAVASGISQPLGSVTVSVDQGACRILPIPNHVILGTVQESIDVMLAKSPGATRRRPDILTMDETGIGIDLAFRQDVPVYPSPDVDIRAHWHYRLFGGQLEAKFDALSVHVRFASWLWALPWNYPGLPIAKAIAEDNLRSSIVRQAADGAEAIEGFVPAGARILSLQHTPTNLEPFVCPDLALRQLLLPGAAVQGLPVLQLGASGPTTLEAGEKRTRAS